MNPKKITKINYSKKFDKQFDKASLEIQRSFRKRLDLFLIDRRNHLLHDHALSGTVKGLRSININGDWRAIYTEREEGMIIFEALGTHSQLYK